MIFILYHNGTKRRAVTVCLSTIPVTGGVCSHSQNLLCATGFIVIDRYLGDGRPFNSFFAHREIPGIDCLTIDLKMAEQTLRYQ
jgi:hypothetical protein